MANFKKSNNLKLEKVMFVTLTGNYNEAGIRTAKTKDGKTIYWVPVEFKTKDGYTNYVEIALNNTTEADFATLEPLCYIEFAVEYDVQYNRWQRITPTTSTSTTEPETVSLF